MNRLTDTTDPANHVTHREYDGGNLTSHNGWTYSYDAQNRLISASSAQSVVQMSYDGRNRCVSRTVNGTTTFLFYESWNLVEERDASGTLAARYIHGARIDELITLTAQPSTLNQTYYYHHDGLSSVTHLTDPAGMLAEKYAYDVFGQPTIFDPQTSILTGSAIGNRFLFTGREHPEELRLHDYRNRVYMESVGRFHQTDPLRLAAMDENLYRYVSNRPANKRDPYGLLACCPIADVRDVIDHFNPESVFGEAETAEWLHQDELPEAARDGAYRHCVATCILRRRFGSLIGWILRKAWDCLNEDSGSRDSQQDMRGEDLGWEAANRSGACDEECLSAVQGL
jgi:RHS repeat-associated protein